MGIETIIAIAAVAASAAATGTAVHQSQQAERQSNDAQRDQTNNLAGQKKDMDAANAQTSAEQEAIAARSRQRSLAAASTGSNYGGTLKTSPLGVTAPPQVSQKALLGL